MYYGNPSFSLLVSQRASIKSNAQTNGADTHRLRAPCTTNPDCCLASDLWKKVLIFEILNLLKR